MFAFISEQEQNLRAVKTVFVKSETANLRSLPSRTAPIVNELTKNTEIKVCYTFQQWSRIYREGKDRLVFADTPELNGWIHSSLLESKEEHDRRMEEIRKKEEKERRKRDAELRADYLKWKSQYFQSASNLIVDIQPFMLEGKMVVLYLYLQTLNQIMIENIGLDVAYSLYRYFGSEYHISLEIYLGRAKVADVDWSIWSQSFVCKFKD